MNPAAFLVFDDEVPLRTAAIPTVYTITKHA